MTREERKELWERVILECKASDSIFIGSNDLLSDEASGRVFVKIEGDGVTKFSEGTRSVLMSLLNFDNHDEIFKVDIYGCSKEDFEQDVEEYVGEINETKEYGLPGMDDMFYVKIVEDDKFTWNYINRK